MMERSAKIVTPPDGLAAKADVSADGSVERVEPPRVYLPACGALCDIFWWARRTPDEPK
jgi:hypothetical protein